MPIQLIIILIGVSISIIGFFLKQTMTRIERLESKVNQHQTEIKILEANHSQLNNRMTELFDAIKELSNEIKSLTKEVSKKKDNN